MRSNLSITWKLALGYMVIAGLATLSALVSYYGSNKIAEPIRTQIPQSLETIRKNSELDTLAQSIKYYDEVLTQAARNYAYTQDVKWKDRYNSVVADLDAILKQAISEGEKEDQELFSSIDVANLALVDMEVRAMELVDGGKAQNAIAILESQEYWDQKGIYSKGLNNYVARRSTSKERSLSGSIQILGEIAVNTERTINLAIVVSGIFSVLVLVLGLTLALIFSRSISAPLKGLVTISQEIARGNLQQRVQVHSRDEIGQLSDAFNAMAQNLEKSYAELETTVQDRTRELNQKLDEVQRMNQLMVDRELKMVALKEELKQIKSVQNK
jgi:HAMP domain-containing protein